MSNILIFSPTPSHPQTAGNRARIFNLAKALRLLNHKIIFVYYTQEGLTPEQEKQMQEAWDQLYIIPKSLHAKIPSQGYYNIDDWYEEGLGEQIQKIIANQSIDIVLCNYIFQSKILDFIPSDIRTIIDTHDKFSNRHIMMQEAGLKPDFFYTIPSQEALGLSRADTILAIQSNEEEFFSSITTKDIYTLGHIQAQNFLEPLVMKNETLTLGFIGSANSVNLLSIENFLENFLARPQAFIQNIKIKIAGSLTKRLDISHPNIELIGYVESLQDFYESVELVINPLLLGTGLKIKTVEALCFGKPIISTAVGFEGLQTTSAMHQHQNMQSLIDSLEHIRLNKEQILEELLYQSKEIYASHIAHETQKLHAIFKPKEQKSTLLITHIDFWNKDLGSKNRLYDLLFHLLKAQDILVLYINPRRPNDQQTINNLGMSKNVIFLEDIQEAEDVDTLPLQRFLEKHSVIQSFVSQKNYEKVATFLRYYSFKKVIIEYIHLSYFLPLFEGCETYLDTHDIMFKRYETFQQNNQKHWIEITKEEEFALFSEYNYVLSIQKHEHEYLLKHGFKTLLVPYSFKITTPRKQKAKKAVIFIGGNTLANQDSIAWFLDNVWDLFAPLDYILEIYGDVSKNIRQDNRRKIYPRGKLDNLDALYGYRDLIAINPVKIGGGLKIKNVEAICSSIALLTTTQGSFGLEDGVNEAFLVADTPDDFKNKLIALMLSKKLRDKLASNGVKYAKQNFHSDVCYSELIQLLQRDEEQK